MATVSTGEITARTKSPNGSRPRFPTVHSPNENLCSGFGWYESLLDIKRPLFSLGLPRLASTKALLRAENRLHSRINPPVSCVILLHDLGVGRIRPDSLHNTHHRIAGSVHRRPDLRADPSEKRGAVSGSLFRLNDLHFVPVDVGLDLPPQGRSCSPATQANALHRNVHFFKYRKGVLQAESHAFQNRSHHMGPGMRCG